MLHSTFQRILRGISANREAEYWRRGILSWDDFEKIAVQQADLFSSASAADEIGPFAKARHAMKTNEVTYFGDLLDRREHYRIPLSFPQKVIFLDIETTGLSRYYDFITLIGWSYQGKFNIYVQGGDEAPFRAALADASVIVTFNGSLFDLPFLREAFHDLAIPPVHIDLRFLAKRVNLAGGQKAIEEETGFKRPARLAEIKGESAPILWHLYRRGDLNALKLLVEYNYCDILGMKFIFDKVIERLLKQLDVPARIRKGIPQFFSKKESLPSNTRTWANSIFRSINVPSYEGRFGPEITLEKLSINDAYPLRVVGIDLTGSESRPSGWCLLNGADAATCTINTDDDLVATTMAAQPHIVSIDSPLSLPKGRTSVFDDDPGRNEYGIMRHSERLLKKRGINVYPALIPSMQRLTARGIRLASRFRSLGMPVIESYPGAAQDIMGIPRKRASLDMLRDGLAEFGIRGDFLKTQVSHDELDAITSAAVGAFFWSGKFEALGIEKEEALIIPDLEVSPKSWRERVVVGISGNLAAGKTTFASYLESCGFHYVRYSMVLETLMQEEGREISRWALQNFGDEVHRERGQRWLGRRLLESLPTNGNVVIDGLRFADDYAFWVETFGPAFHHVHIETKEELRKIRFNNRETNGVAFEEAQSHPVEQQVKTLRGLAHHLLSNDESIQDLRASITQVVPSNIVEV